MNGFKYLFLSIKTLVVQSALSCKHPAGNMIDPCSSHRLPDEANFLLSSDSGELELWNCHPPGHTLEHKTSLGSHDDMALTVGLLAGGQKAVSGGADRKYALYVGMTSKAMFLCNLVLRLKLV